MYVINSINMTNSAHTCAELVVIKCMYSVCITYQRFLKAPFYAVCKM